MDLFDFELDGSDLLGLDARAGPAGEATRRLDARAREVMSKADGDVAQIMCGGGVKVSLPAGAAKAMNAQRKSGGKGGGKG